MCVCGLCCSCRCWNRCGGCWLWATVSQSPWSSSHTINTWSHQWQSNLFPLCCRKGASEAVCRRPSSSETCGMGKHLKWQDVFLCKHHHHPWLVIKHFESSLFQVTDKNYVQILNSWHGLNKPHVFLFDQVPGVPLLYKVGTLHFITWNRMYARYLWQKVNIDLCLLS